MHRNVGRFHRAAGVAVAAALALAVAGCGDDIHARGPEPAVPVPAGSAYDATIDGREVLTPRPPKAPRIHAPAVYGARPGRPIIFRIPTTGVRPIAFSAEHLPETVQLDAANGILTGTTPATKGKYEITLRARNASGRDSATMTLVVGGKLALTPPMGWNSWYTHYRHVADKTIRQAADAMVQSGMADVGYSFVSIDDCWMRMDANQYAAQIKRHGEKAKRGMDVKAKVGPTRDADGNILPARDFPDMKALTDHIHAYGLKAGTYISPGPRTCAGFEGSYQHEARDAKTFADWGFDLLKYDWCSYGGVYNRRMAGSKDPNKARAEHMRPYNIMGSLLASQARDIEMNLCQYGMDSVWKWGERTGGQSWRIGGDLGSSLTRGGVYRTAKKTLDIRRYNGPGHWNDPDYVILGNWLPGAFADSKPVPVALAPDEQYSYMSLWCLMACPLFFSGDMASLDDFTYGILCNPEMIAVNQDPRGVCAEPVVMDANQWVLQKPLADGSVAVGLFNLDRKAPRTITVSWAQLGLAGPRPARDLWRQRDVAFPADAIKVKLGPVGCAVFKISGKQPRKDREQAIGNRE